MFQELNGRPREEKREENHKDTQRISVTTHTEVLVMPPRPGPCEEQKLPTRFERFTDRFVEALSTPTAIVAQSALVAGYIGINVATLTKAIAFDPYPFLFLNLVFSVISGFTTVFVLNSNRRQDQEREAHDRLILCKLDAILKGQKDGKNSD